MKEQAKLPIVIAAVVALVAVLFYFGSKAMGVGNLDTGQVKYTPGKPPWAETDPTKQGPGGSPGGGAPPPPNGPPAGMAPPKVGGGP